MKHGFTSFFFIRLVLRFKYKTDMGNSKFSAEEILGKSIKQKGEHILPTKKQSAKTAIRSTEQIPFNPYNDVPTFL